MHELSPIGKSLAWLKPHKLEPHQRLFFLVSGIFLFTGIMLSDWMVHWMLYIPPIFFLGAALNGYCSMMIITRLVLKPGNNSE